MIVYLVFIHIHFNLITSKKRTFSKTFNIVLFLFDRVHTLYGDSLSEFKSSYRLR